MRRVILLFVIIALAGVGALMLLTFRKKQRSWLAVLWRSPNVYLPDQVPATDASDTPDASWCEPFCQSTFESSFERDRIAYAECRTRAGNGLFEVRNVGGMLKRNKIKALVK